MLLEKIQGGFPPSRCFSVRRHVNSTRVNKIEAMNGRSRVNVKVEPRSTFTFTRDLSYITFISFTLFLILRAFARKTRQWKSTPRVGSHGTGQMINQLKNMNGHFIYTEPFNIFALFTRIFQHLGVLIFVRLRRFCVNARTSNRSKFRPLPCERRLILLL